MKILKTSLLYATLLWGLKLSALSSGFDRGNGSGAFVCKNNRDEIVHSISYDLWINTHSKIWIDGKKIELNIHRHNETSSIEQAHLALDRLDRFNTTIGNVIRNIMKFVMFPDLKLI